MDQVQRYEPPPNRTKPQDTRVQDYIRRFGHDSWELDALEPSVIADVVRDAILALRDEDLWVQAEARQEDARRRLAELAEDWAS